MEERPERNEQPPSPAVAVPGVGSGSAPARIEEEIEGFVAALAADYILPSDF